MRNKIFFAEDHAGCVWTSDSFLGLLEELESNGEYVSSDKKFFVIENPQEIVLDYKMEGEINE